MGRTHALSGAVAYLAIAPALLHAGGVQLAAGTVCAAGAALLPDLDHPRARASTALGPVSVALAHLIAWVSGGHRHATHSLLGLAVFTAAAWAATGNRWTVMALVWALAGLAVRGLHHTRRGELLLGAAVAVAAAAGAWWATATGIAAAIAPAAVGIGVAAHIVGDLLTEEGCPLAWPHRGYWHLGSIDTNSIVERAVVVPALFLLLGVALWRDTGSAHALLI